MATDSDDSIRQRELRISHRTRQKIWRTAEYASYVLILFVGLFPMYWMIQNAFRTQESITSEVSFLPTDSDFTMANFDILSRSDVTTYFLNSIKVTVGTMVLVTVLSLLAGYGMSRFKFKGKTAFSRFLLLGYMFSPIVLALPLFLLWFEIGLLNTHTGLIITLSSFSMPFAVWIMWKYIDTIPESMEEAAWMAGAPRWRGIIDVVLPQTKPAIIANGIFVFAFAWSDFTLAQILLTDNQKTTLAPGLLQLFNSSFTMHYGDFMAIGVIMTVPAFLFAYAFQAYLLKGFQIRAT